jgi:DnaJ-class molecular chaperone
MASETHYEILGVNEKATYDEIKNAHRKLALKLHPDKRLISNKDVINNNNNVTEQAFLKIQAAWKCLGDESKRNNYDDSLKRIRERTSGAIIKAQIVQLSEMSCELCEVEDEDFYGKNDDNGFNRKTKQNVYMYDCRCGDKFEILEEEIESDEVCDENIFECQSCSLSIKIVK